MTTSTRPRGSRRWLAVSGAAVAASVAAALVVPLGAPAAAAAPPPADGLVCMDGTTDGSGNHTFDLTARDGRIMIPDGNTVYAWGFADGRGAFQYPGPVLCVTEGEHVSVTLTNQLPEPTSFFAPQLIGVEFEGQPSEPDLAHGSLTQVVATGKSRTYSFVADRAGTFLYESGTNAEIQRQMGLFGTIVVRPTQGAGYVYDYSDTVFHSPANGDNGRWEFLHLLSEVDPGLHQSVDEQVRAGSTPVAYDMATYQARYYMVNGRSFPDAIEDNFAQHLPFQPYGALVHVWPNGPGNTNPALVRYVNAGPVAYAFHPHSNHEQIVGRDGYAARSADGTDASIDRYGIVVPPGGTAEGLFGWNDAAGQGFSSPDGSDTGNGVPIPDDRDRTDGSYWSGTPFLGDLGPLVVGLNQFNECGEYYHVAHSHALFQVTTNGATMSGMLTMIRIDPPADPTSPTAPRASCTAE